MRICFSLSLIAAAVALWLSVGFSKGLYTYLRLSHQAPIDGALTWEVVPLPKGEYAVEALYRVAGRSDEPISRCRLAPPYYSSPESARHSIEQMKGLAWRAWIDPGSSPLFSSLQRTFPYATTLRLGLAVGIALYFFWLAQYAKRSISSG